MGTHMPGRRGDAHRVRFLCAHCVRRWSQAGEGCRVGLEGGLVECIQLYVALSSKLAHTSRERANQHVNSSSHSASQVQSVSTIEVGVNVILSTPVARHDVQK